METSGVAEAARVKSRDNAESNPAAVRADRSQASVRDKTPARSTRVGVPTAVLWVM
jgi:hypothetical protein